jgi:hypothetical protein
MAEIHVEKKRGAAPWVWLLLIVVLLVAVGWYLWQSGYIHISMIPAVGERLAVAASGGSYGT